MEAAIFSWAMSYLRAGSVFVLVLVLGACVSYPPGVKTVDVPAEGRVRLEPVGWLAPGALEESSGITRSRRHPGVYWTHNDSGHPARLFAVRADGSALPGLEAGVPVAGAENYDWEDSTTDAQGNLIIADVGNNANRRRNLALLILPEPELDPGAVAQVARRYPVEYPDQGAFPPDEMNFDCEGVFVADGKIYLLTKHRSDTTTKLYRLDTHHQGQKNILTLVDRFAIRGMVTAAEAGADGDELAVLTYKGLWLFRRVEDGPSWFSGEVYWLPIRAKQCEALTFDANGDLLLTNEQRDVFRVERGRLLRVR